MTTNETAMLVAPENEPIVWLLIVIPSVTFALLGLTVVGAWCYRRMTMPPIFRQTPSYYGRPVKPDAQLAVTMPPNETATLSTHSRTSRPGVGVSLTQYLRADTTPTLRTIQKS